MILVEWALEKESYDMKTLYKIRLQKRTTIKDNLLIKGKTEKNHCKNKKYSKRKKKSKNK